LIHIGGRTYELIHEHKDGWNPDAFRERYSDVLERYDYVIGDWGYNQLRLKGFFRDNHPKVSRDSAFSGMLDYINEYCNFGCAYFVLQRQPGVRGSGDGEDSDFDDLDSSELFEGIDDPFDMPVRAAGAADAQGQENGQEVRTRIVREHQKREYHRHSRKDADKEQTKDSRKPFAKDRDRDKETGRQQQMVTENQQDRTQNGQERSRSNRQRKPNFTAPKAPVAAAAETTGKSKQTQQPNRK
jgi:uncharacterized protein YutD